MKLYRFSPIKDEAAFREALVYIDSGLDRLSNKLFSKSLPITTLKLFPHYPEEYEYLMKLVNKLGERAAISSITSHYVRFDKEINGHVINYVGVRIVDPYRIQVGCGDCEIENFEEFKESHLGTTPYVRSFREDILELWHPDFDVLAYVLSKSL